MNWTPKSKEAIGEDEMNFVSQHPELVDKWLRSKGWEVGTLLGDPVWINEKVPPGMAFTTYHAISYQMMNEVDPSGMWGAQ